MKTNYQWSSKQMSFKTLTNTLAFDIHTSWNCIDYQNNSQKKQLMHETKKKWLTWLLEFKSSPFIKLIRKREPRFYRLKYETRIKGKWHRLLTKTRYKQIRSKKKTSPIIIFFQRNCRPPKLTINFTLLNLNKTSFKNTESKLAYKYSFHLILQGLSNHPPLHTHLNEASCERKKGRNYITWL